MLTSIPAEVTDDDGGNWTVSRAWPASDGSITFEAASPRSPHVRGGRITATDGVSLATLGADNRLPALSGHAATGTVLVHRPGRRAVVRSADGTRYTKVVRPGRARTVLDAAHRAAVFGRGFRAAAVLDAGEDTVQFQALPGRTVHELGADPTMSSAGWDGLWAEWATAWTQVLAADSSDADGTGADGTDTDRPNAAAPSHDASNEAEVVRTWSRHAHQLRPAGAEPDRLADTAERVCALLGDGAGQPLVASHRDLHDKQLLWQPGVALGLLDLDTSTRAEAALDLGNLTAHLMLRHRQGLWSAARSDRARAVVRATADTLGIDPTRLHAYETAARFRIACLYGYRPRWAALAGRLQRELTDELASPAGRAR